MPMRRLRHREGTTAASVLWPPAGVDLLVTDARPDTAVDPEWWRPGGAWGPVARPPLPPGQWLPPAGRQRLPD
jgi:hypothetical protein